MRLAPLVVALALLVPPALAAGQGAPPAAQRKMTEEERLRNDWANLADRKSTR